MKLVNIKQSTTIVPQSSVVEPIKLDNVQLVAVESPDPVSMQWEWT